MSKTLKQLLKDIESLKLISADVSEQFQKQTTVINQLTNYVNKQTADFQKTSMDSLEDVIKGIEINAVHLQILHEKQQFLHNHINELYSKIDIISTVFSEMLTKKKK